MKSKKFNAQGVPQEILNNTELNQQIAQLLPSNYDFEIHKTIHRICKMKSQRVALQFPEGFLKFAYNIQQILMRFCVSPGYQLQDVIVLADPVYGACCVDDTWVVQLQADYLIHYGHSCLVPIESCKIPVIYVFVYIQIDIEQFLSRVKESIQPCSLSIVGTIQFTPQIQEAIQILGQQGYNTQLNKNYPRVPGEILGCTAPFIQDKVEAIICLTDGSFHIEAIQIANPQCKVWQYDPYSQNLTKFTFNIEKMMSFRFQQITQAKNATVIGLIFGTLGRQCNEQLYERVKKVISQTNKEIVEIQVREIEFSYLRQFEQAFIQKSTNLDSVFLSKTFNRLGI